MTLASQEAITSHTCSNAVYECVGPESTLATIRLQHSHDFAGVRFSSVCFLQHACFDELATCCGAGCASRQQALAKKIATERSETIHRG